MKSRINITVDEVTLKKFRKYCKREGMKISSRIELLMRKDLQKREK